MNFSVSISFYTVFKKIPFKTVSHFFAKVASIAIPIITILHLHYKKKNAEQKELDRRVQVDLNEQLRQRAERIAQLAAENALLRDSIPALEQQLSNLRGAAARSALEIETLKQESTTQISTIELLRKKAVEDSSTARTVLSESAKEKLEIGVLLEAARARITELERVLAATYQDLRTQIGRTEAAIQRIQLLEEPASSPRRDYVAIDFHPPRPPEGAFVVDFLPSPTGEDLV